MFFTLNIAQVPAPNLPDIEEIEIPEPLPDPWKNALWIALGVLAFIVIAIVVYITVRSLLAEKKRTLSAEYVALKAISEIEPKMAMMSPNEFSLQLSEVLKDFAQKRFNDPLRYETTNEFLGRIAESENVSMTPQVRDQLGEFLAIAEEIKFGLPPDAEAQKEPLFEKATHIVETQRAVMREAAEAAAKKR